MALLHQQQAPAPAAMAQSTGQPLTYSGALTPLAEIIIDALAQPAGTNAPPPGGGPISSPASTGVIANPGPPSGADQRTPVVVENIGELANPGGPPAGSGTAANLPDVVLSAGALENLYTGTPGAGTGSSSNSKKYPSYFPEEWR